MGIGGARCAVLAAVLGAAALAVGAAPAGAFRAGGAAWPGRPATITYWNGSPYKAEVRAAVRAWNRSGARVRFVPAPRSSARVPITTVPRTALGAALGFASIGVQGRNYVHLARLGRGYDPKLLATIVAHELGHVIGLDHEDRRCATMNATAWTGCGRSRPCEILQRDDIRGAVARYGGRVRRSAPVLCPAAPADARVAPSANSYGMTLTARVPAGTSLVTRVAAGDRCPARPFGAASARAAATQRGEAFLDLGPDPAGFRGKRFCASAWARDGDGRLSLRHATVRFAGAVSELPAPTGLAVQPGSYRVTLTWKAVRFGQVDGYEVAGAFGETCPDRPDAAGAELRAVAPAYPGEDGRVTLTAERRGPVCIAVWSRDRFGTLSAPASIRAEITGNADPFAAFTLAGDAPVPGVPVVFADGSGDPENALTAWAWDFGDPGSGAANTSGERNPSHTYAAPGTYTVTLRVTDDGGATAETSQEVVVEAPPP